MSTTHDTRCSHCGSTFACPVLGMCPFCGARYLEPFKAEPSVMAQAFDAINRAPAQAAAVTRQSRTEALDWIELTCARIQDELRTLEPLSAEEARIIQEAIHNLRPRERGEVGA